MSTQLGLMGVHSIFNNISAIVLFFSRYLMKEIKVDEVNQHCFVNMSQTVCLWYLQTLLITRVRVDLEYVSFDLCLLRMYTSSEI